MSRLPAAPLRRVTLEDLEEQADDFDAAALRTPDIDAFCSSSAWVLSAHAAFHPEQQPWVWTDGLGSWLVLAHATTPEIGRYLAPLEAMWGLASPVVASDPGSFASRAAEALLAVEDAWDALWLCGLRPGSQAFRTLAFTMGRRFRLFRGPTTRRQVADLDGGWEGWLSRRPRTQRKSLRRAERRAAEAGVRWEWHDAVPDEAERAALYARAVAVDDRSWKGIGEQGLSVGGMAAFYDHMTRRLAQAGTLRLVIGVLDGVDIAMGFGAAFGDTFRGLQMSYDDRYRHLALGNLVQARLIRACCDEGMAWYDLGTEMAYKDRWSEPGLETVALVVRR